MKDRVRQRSPIQSQALSSQNVFVILNPVAGNVNADAVSSYLQQFFISQNWDFEIYQTSGQDDVHAIIVEKINAGITLVVAIGGDGTISEVVNGLALSNIPLAIIPLGTGNIIAHELGIPFDLEEACALIADHRHKIRHLDLMQVGDRYFISHISLGIYSLIIGSIRPEDKRRFGRLVYIWEAIRRLLQRKRWRFNIRIDSSTLSIRASLVLVANAGAVGLSSLRWGEHISPDDQHLALCIIKGETLSDYLRLLWNMARNRHYTDKNITYFNAKQHISIETKQDLPVRADGEIIGESRVSIQLVPTAINIITR